MAGGFLGRRATFRRNFFRQDRATPTPSSALLGAHKHD